MARGVKVEKHDKNHNGSTKGVSKQIKSADNEHLNGLIAANLTDSTDFSIELGIHSWRVHSKVVSAKSRYFEIVCSNQYKEGQDRAVSITEEDPWNIARLIQFFYTDDFDIDPKAESKSAISLLDLVKQGAFPDEEQIEAQSKITLLESCNSMWHIAQKYDIPLLRWYTADKLVYELECHCIMLDPSSHYVKDLSEKLSNILEMIGPAISEMPEIEDRVVDLLLRHVSYHRLHQGKGCPLLGSTTSDAPTSADHNWSQQDMGSLVSVVRPYMNNNATFATKIAAGLEHMLMKAFYIGSWSTNKIRSVSHKADG